MSLRVGMYLRKSSYGGNKRVERGRSVKEQEAENRTAIEAWNAAAADDRQMLLVERYTDDDRSASRYKRKEREEYNRAVADIEDGRLDVLQAWQSSRIQRDLAVYVALRDLCWASGVLWFYNGRVYDLSRREDRLATGLEALIGEDQAELIRDDVLRAVRNRAAEGKPHGKLLYGYRREYDPDTGRMLAQVVDESKARYVREAARRVLAGEAPNAVGQDFIERGVPAPRSGVWDLTKIRRMLTNPAYISRRILNGVDVGPGQWPPILEENDFAVLAGKFGDPNRRSSKDTEAKHLLSGIATCGALVDGVECGLPLRVNKNRGYLSYTCWGRQGRRGDGTRFHTSRRETRVDYHVTWALFERLAMPDARDWLASAGGDDERTRQARDEAEAKRARLEEWARAAEREEVSSEMYGRMERKLAPEIASAEARARPAYLPGAVTDLLADTAEGVATEWEELDFTTQREILRSLVRVRLMPVGRGNRWADPAESIKVTFAGDGG